MVVLSKAAATTSGGGWGPGILWMNLAAAGIAFVSDVTSQILIEGKRFKVCKKRSKKKKEEKGEFTEEDQIFWDDPENWYSWQRGLKFTGLNVLICVPTAMWIGWLESKVMPGKPILQTLLTAFTWSPMMFSIALMYRAIFFVDLPDKSACQRIVATFKSDFKYFPFTYLYTFPVMFLTFFVIPLKIMPVFVAVVDFLSDIFSSWWLHRRKIAMKEEAKVEEVSDKKEGEAMDTMDPAITEGEGLAEGHVVGGEIVRKKAVDDTSDEDKFVTSSGDDLGPHPDAHPPSDNSGDDTHDGETQKQDKSPSKDGEVTPMEVPDGESEKTVSEVNYTSEAPSSVQ